MTLLRRSILVLLLICLGCSAQSAPPDVALRIEHQVRSVYKLPAEVKITLSPLKVSEFPTYDTVTITLDGGDKKQTYDFLLSKDGKTLIRMTKLDVSQDPFAQVMKKIDTSGRPTRGNKAAKVVAVNYDDFQCPFCSRMHQTLFPEILKEYGDRVVFIYKDFPLAEIHPWATHAAVNANCLASQNADAYWDFADYVHAHLADLKAQKTRDAQFSTLDKQALTEGAAKGVDSARLQACLKTQNDDTVTASLKEGKALGVEATPTMFVNGQQVDGALPLNELRAVLDRALQEVGVPAPVHPASAPEPAGSAEQSSQ